MTNSLVEKSLINIISFDAFKSKILDDCTFSLVICVSANMDMYNLQ